VYEYRRRVELATKASEASDIDVSPVAFGGGEPAPSEVRLVVVLEAAIGLIPGKPEPVSPLGIGVAVGSIVTAERIGKTRSTEPGLRFECASSDLVEAAGDTGPEPLPVNMLTGDCVGPIGIHVGGRCPVRRFGGSAWGCCSCES
jgi:hypothetical protein